MCLVNNYSTFESLGFTGNQEITETLSSLTPTPPVECHLESDKGCKRGGGWVSNRCFGKEFQKLIVLRSLCHSAQGPTWQQLMADTGAEPTQHQHVLLQGWISFLRPVPLKVDGKMTVEFGGSRWGLFSLFYFYFPGLLSIPHSKCKLDPLERSIPCLPGVPGCWWTWGCTTCKGFWLCNVLLLVSSGQGKHYYYQSWSKSKTHWSSNKHQEFQKSLREKKKRKEHTMILHSMYVR